jgi:acetoin utilization deacetylase AcuC-like enzyme
MGFALISHPDCLLHEMGPLHPEQPARIQVIDEAISTSPLSKKAKKILAPQAACMDLYRVHDKNYVDQIFEVSPSIGSFILDGDTMMNPYTLQAALHAAGSVIYAIDSIMSNEFKVAFCNVRPPGHHAMKDQAMGFCIFNNVAVGVARALAIYQLRRILIFDFDVHHGNGTEDIFKQDERILLCSAFQYPFYPFAGPISHESNVIHIPLMAGTNGKSYLKKIQDHAFKRIIEFSPEIVFFSAGFDAHYRDQIAGLNLTESDYGLLTSQIRSIVQESCQGRFVSVLEGGYVLDVLGKCVVYHLSHLIE